MKKITTLAILAIAAMMLLMPTVALADQVGNAGVSVSYTVGDCGQVTFNVTNLTSNIGNMYFVVEENGAATAVNVPAGTTVSWAVPAVFEDTTVYWRVFGGGERDYDLPLWNGHGSPSFGANIATYANSVGTYNWVIAGTNDPNPFTTWNTLPVQGCPLTKDQCKDDGWVSLGYRNQGLCIQEANRQAHDN